MVDPQNLATCQTAAAGSKIGPMSLAPAVASAPEPSTEDRLEAAQIPPESRPILTRGLAMAYQTGREAGHAVRRSIDLHAELRRVCGPSFPLRAG